MRGRDQIFLPARQCVLILIATLATAAAALLLRLLVLHLKRLHFDEVDVAGRFITRIARFRKIGDEVAGLEIVFLEKERVGAASASALIRASVAAG